MFIIAANDTIDTIDAEAAGRPVERVKRGSIPCSSHPLFAHPARALTALRSILTGRGMSPVRSSGIFRNYAISAGQQLKGN